MEVVVTWIKIGVVFFVLTILAVFDVSRKDFGTLGRKIVWAIVALIPFIGWLIYLLFGFRKGKKPTPPSSNNV